ncbi:MAG TPA: PAS domain-containing protein [Enhygromyxa sp.]|nr:PAS domain-containing protein [Enhygromyxa sp.]
MLVHDPPAHDAPSVLEHWAQRRPLRREALVAVVDGREMRRAALRGGASAVIERSSLDSCTLQGAIEDAVDRAAAAAAELELGVWHPAQSYERLWDQIEARFGVRPSFFTVVGHEPPVARALFEFTQSACLDNPIPKDFKQNLLVYLSRFSPTAYCLARQSAFMLGSAAALDTAPVRALLEEPLPKPDALAASLAALEGADPLAGEWPAWDSSLGVHVRVACSQVLMHSHQRDRWLAALRKLLGRVAFERLALLLSFVRAAHHWSELHPNLEFDDDMTRLLGEHEELATSLAANTRAAVREAEADVQLAAELQQLRARLEDAHLVRELADALPAYVSYIDSRQRYLFLNKTYSHRFQRSAAELRGKTVAEVLGPENYEGVRPYLEAALRGKQIRGEYALQLPNGACMHVDAALVPDRRVDGSIAGVVAMVVDVTERRRAQDLTRRVLDNLFAFVGLLELDGTLVEVNNAPLAAAGIKLAEVRGKKFWDCHWWSYSAASQAIVREACERAARGETVRHDAIVRVIDDGRKVMDFQIAPLRDADGEVVYLVPSAVDVTNRVKVEQVLRESEERLRMAQDAAGLGIHDLDLRTGAARWDRRARELWGLGREDPISFESFVSGVHPDDRPALQAAIDGVADPKGPGILQVEHRIIRRSDGQVRWIAVTGRTTFEDGQPVRMVGTMQDITCRKHAEDALRRSQEQLRESDRRKDEFLAMLGHELRNPLAAICSAAELLDVYATDDPRLGTIRDALERQSNHMVRLIDGLLEVSRIARGKLHLEWKTVNLCDVLAGVLHDRSEQLVRGRLTLQCELPEQPLWVWGDEVRLAQIFDNLLGNAIKFTAESGTIRVVAQRRDDLVSVSIADTGVGIRPEMLESIFELFRQDSQQIARATGGLGIGLALVRGLVELHHGSVVARSDGPGLGAEFEVQLPISGPPAST